MIRVLIADDQELFSELLEHMLSKIEDIDVISRVNNGEDAIINANILKPDIILMDVAMPICNGVDAIKKIRDNENKCKILVLTTSKDGKDVQDAIKAGANGYILKSVSKEKLIIAIRSVHAGMEVRDKEVVALFNQNSANMDGRTIKTGSNVVQLSERDLKILQMIVDGKSAQEMSQELFVTEGRTRNLITELSSKLMLQDKTQLAVFAIRNKLVKFE